MSKLIVIAASAIFLATGVAEAQQAPRLREGHLNRLDTNKDGSVSRAEYEAFMRIAFAKLDSNGDDFIIPNDVANILTGKQFSDADANNDGRLSRGEFLSQVMQDFTNADRDGDGLLK